MRRRRRSIGLLELRVDILPPVKCLMRLCLCCRCHAVLAVSPRGAHGKEATVTVWVEGGGTTLYLLPGLVVSTAASTPSGWDLSGSTSQVEVYVEVDVGLPFGIASPLK